MKTSGTLSLFCLGVGRARYELQDTGETWVKAASTTAWKDIKFIEEKRPWMSWSGKPHLEMQLWWRQRKCKKGMAPDMETIITKGSEGDKIRHVMRS